MKGSPVFYGFKSFADKFHSQLPLNQKEASRLLTALTSSFRKHLDEVHPPKATDETHLKNAVVSGPPKIKGNIHSSAALADNHLASLLANPLLAQRTGPPKADKDYLIAKSALENNAGQDPIKLLEDFPEWNRESIPVAYLCLKQFEDSIKDLPEQARKDARDSSQSARRILLWLRKRGLFESSLFTQNLHFQNLLFSCACKENLEHDLWRLFKADVTLRPTNEESSHPSSQTQINRWKLLMLRYMVAHRIEADPTMDAAFDLFRSAHDLVLSAPPGNHMHDFPPLIGIQTMLRNAFLRFPRPRPFDAKRLDQFVSIIADRNTTFDPGNVLRQLTIAQLLLCHPLRRTTEPALKVWTNIARPDRFPKFQTFLDKLQEEPAHAQERRPKNNSTSLFHYRVKLHVMLVRLAHYLQKDDRHKEAEWALSLTERFFPELAPLNQKYQDQLLAVERIDCKDDQKDSK